MLDAPIRAGGAIAGVICHEHVGPVRRWEVDEQNFAAFPGETVALREVLGLDKYAIRRSSLSPTASYIVIE